MKLAVEPVVLLIVQMKMWNSKFGTFLSLVVGLCCGVVCGTKNENAPKNGWLRRRKSNQAFLQIIIIPGIEVSYRYLQMTTHYSLYRMIPAFFVARQRINHITKFKYYLQYGEKCNYRKIHPSFILPGIAILHTLRENCKRISYLLRDHLHKRPHPSCVSHYIGVRNLICAPPH
jgi:hypothetical protein